MSNQRVRWGILGAAKIAREKLIPAIDDSELGELVALGSRSVEKASIYTARLDGCVPYGSYQEVIQDSNVEAIYIPLPNDMHIDWSIKALEAGKHVLCEKPLGLNLSDVKRLVEVSKKHPGQKVMEAFMYRFHPQWRCVQELLRAERIGRVRTVQSTFTYNNRDPYNIRNNPEAGGGALMDIGCYAVSLSRFVFGSEPREVSAVFDMDQRFEVDNVVSAIMQFSCGGVASFSCTTKTESGQAVYIGGEAGSITMSAPFYNKGDLSTVVRVVCNNEVQEYDFSNINHYTRMVDSFCESVLNDEPVMTPIDDAIANMRALDAISESALTKSWIRV